MGILKDLLAKERLRVREANDEIAKWKNIANDLQRELNDLKLRLTLNEKTIESTDAPNM